MLLTRTNAASEPSTGAHPLIHQVCCHRRRRHCHRATRSALHDSDLTASVTVERCPLHTFPAKKETIVNKVSLFHGCLHISFLHQHLCYLDTDPSRHSCSPPTCLSHCLHYLLPSRTRDLLQPSSISRRNQTLLCQQMRPSPPLRHLFSQSRRTPQ